MAPPRGAAALLPLLLALQQTAAGAQVEAEALAARYAGDAANWRKVFARGSTFGDYPPANARSVFDEAFAKNGIAVRVCADCTSTHMHIVYVRKSPVSTTFSAYDNFIDVWASQDNQLNRDFELYSTLDDFAKGINKWTFCNFNDFGGKIGFPRDCGPSGKVDYQWTSLRSGGKREYVYYVYVGAPTGEWPVRLDADGSTVSLVGGAALTKLTGNAVRLTSAGGTIAGALFVRETVAVATDGTHARRPAFASCDRTTGELGVDAGGAFACVPRPAEA